MDQTPTYKVQTETQANGPNAGMASARFSGRSRGRGGKGPGINFSFINLQSKHILHICLIKLTVLLGETFASSSSLSHEGEIKGLFSNSPLLLLL